MSTFTPGPWSIVPYGDGSSLVIHSDSDNRVCFMATASSDRPTSHAAIRANAALIAAAPVLYEALSNLIIAADTMLRHVDVVRERGEFSHWQSFDLGDCSVAIDEASRALAAASRTSP